MVSKVISINNENLREYAHAVGYEKDPVLEKLREETQKLGDASIMQIGSIQGALIEMLCRIGQYEKCLEIGVFTGYSSICIARGMSENGNLYAVDTSKEFTSIAEKYWKMAELDHKIHLTIDKGLNFLEKSIKNNNNDFDLIFIDADKENYIKYYEMSLSIIRRGGIIIIDNTIWKGKVMNEDDKTRSTSTIRELNNLISKDTRVSQCMVTMYDGMTICQKK